MSMRKMCLKSQSGVAKRLSNAGNLKSWPLEKDIMVKIWHICRCYRL